MINAKNFTRFLGAAYLTMAASCSSSPQEYSSEKIVADLDNDGRTDIVELSRASSSDPYTLSVRLGGPNELGSRTVIETFPFASPDLTLSLEVAYISRDNVLDIRYIRPGSVSEDGSEVLSSVLIHRNGRGDGTFSPERLMKAYPGWQNSFE